MTHNNGRRPRLRSLVPSTAIGALTVGVALSTPVAQALNTVPTARGDSWQVQDVAIPGLDTGSVTRTGGLALQGYGGLRVEVDGGTSRLNGILLRGFGLTFDGRNTFSTTQGVKLDGLVVQRELVVDREDGYGRFFDSFTNTTHQPITVDVAFGGQLGYNTGANQSAIAATSSGDESIGSDDGWAAWYSPSDGAGSASRNGPSATVAGSPDAEATIARMGNFLRDPFTNDLATTGDEANHPAFVTELVIEPGSTESLARYVVAGNSEVRSSGSGAAVPEAGSELEYVESTADALLGGPDLAGLNTSEVCSIVNFDAASLGITGDECDQASSEPIQNDVTGAVQASTPKTTSPYDVVGRTITDQLSDLNEGTANSQQIVRAYLDRIAAYDRGPFGLRSVLSVAPDAMKQARAADKARRNGDDRPLLGVPIIVKDIVDTKDMVTTGGSLLFDGWTPQDDAWQVKKLREAGAIILGKANLSRFAFSGHFSESNFGQVWNAFDPSRSSIGSSGGSAVSVASSFGAAAIGTQTGDSLWGPSWGGSLYSLRGTDGMQSSSGVMPLAIIQDYVGFMAQSLDDLALLLEVAAVDNPDDVLDDVANGNRPSDWTEYMTDDALQGQVIGIPAEAFDDPFGTTVTSDALRAQFAVFEQAGATVIDMPAAPSAPDMPADLGSVWSQGNYEGWEQWFAAHPDAPTTIDQVSSATEGWTDEQQRLFEGWRSDYRAVLADWMDDSGVDAVLYPEGLSDIHLNDSTGNSFGRRDPQSSASGVPTVIFPAGTNAHGTPIGFQLQGKAFQDAELMGFAYAFEQIAEGRAIPEWSVPLVYDEDAIPGPIEPLEPMQPTEPGTRRPTVLDSEVKLKAKKARAVLSIGCASADGPCRSKVIVKLGGKRLAAKQIRVSAGGLRKVSTKLPGRAKRRLVHGKTVTLRVTFAGKGSTESVRKPIKVRLHR